MMKKLMIWAMALLMMPFAADAQVSVKVNLSAPDTVGMRVFVYPLGVDTGDDSDMTRGADGMFAQTIESSETGLYNMVCVTGTAQYSLPLYLDATAQMPIVLDVTLGEGSPNAVVVPNIKGKKGKQAVEGVNRNLAALHEFNELYYVQSRDVWMNTQSKTEDDIRQMVARYNEMAAKTEADAAISSSVKEYVKVWAYLQGAEAGSVYNRMHEQKIPISGGEGALLPEPNTALDTPMSALHGSSVSVAAQALPKGTLLERLAYINSSYKNEMMRQGIQRIVLNAFIRNYDYTKGYQQGLEAMLKAQKEYAIDESFVAAFKERVSAIPGAKFPDVALIDAAGKTVTLDMFKGKYVYIDLWASWCVPCVKEIPYLQKLEAELQNENVVFVSISNDSSEAPWRKKMEQLQLHGNQWLNTDGKLCDKLNVSGIPHFLIYDKEGRLHTYDAPRPSTGSALKGVLEGLK